MEELVIEVERRSSAGKGVSKKLRQQGLIPAVVYGGGKETVPVIVNRHAVTELLRQERGRNTIFLLKMKGTKQERHAMLRDAQIDPLTRQFIHLDFIRVMKGQLLKIEVPIVLEGESEGVKVGGFLDWLGRSLHVECQAETIPQALRVDVSSLEVGHHVAASDVQLPEGVKLVDDPHKVIVTIKAHGPKGLEEEVAAAPEAVTEEVEPEVIRRGKTAEESEGAE
ncbi:MAG: 50S ribosomal protein L25 [Acidobacteriota bacterium]